VEAAGVESGDCGDATGGVLERVTKKERGSKESQMGKKAGSSLGLKALEWDCTRAG